MEKEYVEATAPITIIYVVSSHDQPIKAFYSERAAETYAEDYEALHESDRIVINCYVSTIELT